MNLSSLVGGAGAAKTWAKEHWVTIVVVVLLVLAAAYAGHKLSPGAERVVEKEHVVTKTQVEYRDRVVEKVVQKVVYVRQVQKHVKTTTVDVKKPDGTVEHKVEVTDLSHTETSNTADKVEVRTEIKYVDRIVEKTVDKLKIVEAYKPQWRLGAGAAYDVMFALGRGTRGVPGMDGFAVQVEADRRILGPFWLGIWGTTTGLAGLHVSGEF